MPELMEISGLSSDDGKGNAADQVAPAASKDVPIKAVPQAMPSIFDNIFGKYQDIAVPVLIVGGVGALIYIINKFFPMKTTGISVGPDFKIPGLEDSDEDCDEQMGVIRACRPKDRTKKRPAKDQKVCLFTSNGKRLLGRHPNKKRAMKQEKLIEMKKHGVPTRR
jgi:hypothetical protein